LNRSEAAPLVLTGATGFLGRELVRRLAAEVAVPGAERSVTLLVRSPDSLPPDVRIPSTWRVVACDLSNQASTLPPGILPPACVVLHLAAVTGRAPAALMHRVNVDGTRMLAEAARRADARHFVLVSSIAAGYRRQRWYPYAASKQGAEAALLASGVPATIVRPTMVFGPGSRVQEGLERLAGGRFPIVLGGGNVLVQPVDVRDLADLLLALVDHRPMGAEPLEIGSGDRYSMRTLLARIRAARGLPARSPWSVPLGLPRLGLAAAEGVFGPKLPVTAGQLSAFLNDSVATSHPVVDLLLPPGDPLRSVVSAPSGGATPGDDAALGGAAELEREFKSLAQHLGTERPSTEAVAAYCRGHPRAIAVPFDALDLRLLRLARRSPVGCVLADSYARLTRPYGLLRRKLVLALAVLEADPERHAEYDTGRVSALAVAWTEVVLLGVRWLAWTMIAVLVLAPGHLVDHWNSPRETARDG